LTYEIYDAAVLVAGAPAGLGVYIIGTNANTAILGSWPQILTLPTPLPTPAQHLKIRATVDCLIMLHSFDMLAAQAQGGYPAGLPTAIYLVGGQLYEIDFPTCILYHMQAAAGASVIYVQAYA